MYMVTTVKNSVLQIRKLPREAILKVTTIKKKKICNYVWCKTEKL